MNPPGKLAVLLFFCLPVIWLLGCSLPAPPSLRKPINRPTAIGIPLSASRQSTEPSPTPSANNLEPTWTVIPTPSPIPTDATTSIPKCQEPGRIVTGQFPSNLTGSARPYRIFLPPCFGQDGRVYPTLYMFHGSAQNDRHWDELGLDEAANQAILAGLMEPYLIVLPNGGDLAQNSSGGPYSFEGVVLSELIPFIEANYCAWPAAEGRALGGLSRGGYWALEIAFRNPQVFAAVGGHSAALLDTAAGPQLDPLSTVLSADLGALRIYLDIGQDDWVMPNLRRLHEAMVNASISHEWTVNEGQHENAYWSSHTGEYLLWYAESWPLSRDNYPLCQKQLP